MARIQTVVIIVEGGIAHLVRKPKGTRVVIRDYDVEAQDEAERSKLKVDKNGDAYGEAIFWENRRKPTGLSLSE